MTLICTSFYGVRHVGVFHFLKPKMPLADYYLYPTQETQLVVDTSRGETLNINVSLYTDLDTLFSHLIISRE